MWIQLVLETIDNEEFRSKVEALDSILKERMTPIQTSQNSSHSEVFDDAIYFWEENTILTLGK